MLEEQQALSEARILLTVFTAVHIRPLIDGGMMGQVELVEHGFVKVKGKGREVRIFELRELPTWPGLPASYLRGGRRTLHGISQMENPEEIQALQGNIPGVVKSSW